MAYAVGYKIDGENVVNLFNKVDVAREHAAELAKTIDTHFTTVYKLKMRKGKYVPGSLKAYEHYDESGFMGRVVATMDIPKGVQ